MPRTSKSAISIRSLWVKPETIIGLTALIFLVAMGIQTWNSTEGLLSTASAINQNATMQIPSKVEAETASPAADVINSASQSAQTTIIPEESNAEAKIESVTAAPTAIPTPTPATQQNVEQSETRQQSGRTVVIARINDTFWHIAGRTCGEGVQGYRIKEENGYSRKHLQPGDEIVVTCN